MKETKQEQVQRLCRDQVIHNVADRGIDYLDPAMVASLTYQDGVTPQDWFVAESARYYKSHRGPYSIAYLDAPALAVLQTRSAILAWRAARG
jgi:hypothetical protein